jgi:hypothetical protein
LRFFNRNKFSFKNESTTWIESNFHFRTLSGKMIAKSDSAVERNKDQVSFEVSESLFQRFMADLIPYAMFYFINQPKLKYILNYEYKSKWKCNS